MKLPLSCSCASRNLTFFSGKVPIAKDSAAWSKRTRVYINYRSPNVGCCLTESYWLRTRAARDVLDTLNMQIVVPWGEITRNGKGKMKDVSRPVVERRTRVHCYGRRVRRALLRIWAYNIYRIKLCTLDRIYLNFRVGCCCLLLLLLLLLLGTQRLGPRLRQRDLKAILESRPDLQPLRVEPGRFQGLCHKTNNLCRFQWFGCSRAPPGKQQMGPSCCFPQTKKQTNCGKTAPHHGKRCCSDPP